MSDSDSDCPFQISKDEDENSSCFESHSDSTSTRNNKEEEEEIDFSVGDSRNPSKNKRKRIQVYEDDSPPQVKKMKNFFIESHSKKRKERDTDKPKTNEAKKKRGKKALEIKESSKSEDWWKEHMEKDPTLEQISKMVKDVAATTARKQKLSLLEKHADCVKIHLYTNNPFWQYYVSSTRVKKTMSNVDIRSQGKNAKNIFHLLDLLKTREVTGNAALGTVCNFVTVNKKYESLIYSILDKNLKIRCGTATINAVFPKLVPEFPVALAENITDVPESQIDFENDRWYALRKFDGVRVIAMVKNGNVEFRSREGNAFVTLQILENIINAFDLKEDIIFDGELCIFENDREDFKKAVSEIKKKSGMITNPRYVIFDTLTFEEFKSKTSERIYSQRLDSLRKVLKGKKHEPYLGIVECIEIVNEKHLEKLKETATKKEWEGLILRKDCEYEGKRSNSMVKIKKFQTEEFKVIDTETGPFRIVVEGKEETIETLTAVIIKLDDEGNTCSVGSGFTLEERKKYYKKPKEIVGKIIGVQFFERSKDRTGKPSLRFPVFVANYGDKRDV